MSDKRPSPLAPILIAVLLVAMLPSAYMAGYFWLGKQRNMTIRDGSLAGAPPRRIVSRTYPATWIALLFSPAGKLESRLRGADVRTAAMRDGILNIY